jgi:hypothetical protein
MSSLIVEIVKIDKVVNHPDPATTSLDVATVKGWNCLIKRGTFKEDDLCVYFPIDSILPLQLSDAIGATKYLRKGRVVATKLRGIPSYGLLWELDNAKKYIDTPNRPGYGTYPLNWDVGQDLAFCLGVTKWDPEEPVHIVDKNESPKNKKYNAIFWTAKFLYKVKLFWVARKVMYLWQYLNKLIPIKDLADFHKYTDIENYRNYPDVIPEGEPVAMTEKIHGSNVRLGCINGKFVVGSHNVRKGQQPGCKFWGCLTDNVKEMLLAIYKLEKKPVIVYGEIYGSKIQDLTYGLTNGETAFRVFDIKIGDIYMGYGRMIATCHNHNVAAVPELYIGPFSFAKIKEIEAKKKSTLADNMMEGVVIKALDEKLVQFNPKHVGLQRMILKYVFSEYLCRKDGTEYH